MPSRVLKPEPVHSFRTFSDVSFRVNEAMVLTPGHATIDQLDTSDLDNAVALRSRQAGSFCIQYDLSHDYLCLCIDLRSRPREYLPKTN